MFMPQCAVRRYAGTKELLSSCASSSENSRIPTASTLILQYGVTSGLNLSKVLELIIAQIE